MTADEIRKEIAGRKIRDYRKANGKNGVYCFMQYVLGCVGPGRVADTLEKLPDEEVEKHYEEWQLQYAREQIEQEL